MIPGQKKEILYSDSITQFKDEYVVYFNVVKNTYIQDVNGPKEETFLSLEIISDGGGHKVSTIEIYDPCDLQKFATNLLQFSLEHKNDLIKKEKKGKI